ncbi:MAG: fibronectin type III domain-containing protein [Candidatus Parcubacteria bacterium]|nr:fibronectin type III domain-containing protein [Candidatus Parcubacteria bacterium]
MKSLSKAVLVMAMAIALTLTFFACSGSDSSHDDGNPPLTPTLSAYAAYSSQINLYWTLADAKNTNGVILQRSVGDESNYAQILATYPTVNSYQDTALVCDTVYYYRLLAYNEYGFTFSNSSWAQTLFNGYEMCVNKTHGYCPSVLYAQCGKALDNNSQVSATGAEVFTSLKQELVVPSTMTVNFSYTASASTCFNQPYLEVVVGTQSQNFSYSCTFSGEDSISIPIASGQTLADISFLLNSGDWAALVYIKSITFAP